MKLTLTLLLAAMAVGCGYSSKSTTPATPGTAPVITQLTPPNMNAGAQAFPLEIDGTKFNSNATVNFGTTIIHPTFIDSTQLNATVPAAAVATAGVVHVTVTNPGKAGGIYGGGTQPATSAAVDFTVN
jgi:hypothetical protein